MMDNMPLEILQNKYRIKLADDDFFKALFNNSEKFGEFQAIFESFNGLIINYFYENTNVYYINEMGIWFSHVQHNTRSFYAFGINEPKKDETNIPTCVVDFPMEKIDDNCLGAYADNNGNVTILIRINYQKLRKKSISDILTGQKRTQALENGKKRYFINLGPINEQELLDNIRNFVYEMESITDHSQILVDLKDSKSNYSKFGVSESKRKRFLKAETKPEVETESTSKNTTETCVLCKKPISDSKLDLKIKSLKNFHPDKCHDCLEKIYAAKALSEIKKLVSIKLFNEKTLIKNADDPDTFKSYFKILKKLELIKEFSKDIYIFNQAKDIDKFIEKYSKFFEANDDIIKTVESDEIENKQCAVCGKKLDLDKFYKSDDSPDGLTTICKECSRKSHAAKAIEEIRNYIDPSTPFNKEDLLKQSNNRMVFLDYFWTLQEFNLLEEDKKPDYYHLTDEKELNEFIEKYGLKTPKKTPPKVEEAPKKKKTPKLAKTCEICNLKLPISDFFKTHDSEDGYSAKCKKCSRKSYAARALNALLDCVEPDVLFYKKDLLDQCENQIRFKDYCWTLQEFDLLDYNEKDDSYRLKPEEVVNQFINRYSEKGTPAKAAKEKLTQPDETPPVMEINKKAVKKCATCGKILPVSNFYKSSSTNDGLLDSCKSCSEKTNAAKILSEIQNYVDFGNPFTKDELSNKIKNETKANYYIWTLQEQNLLIYNEKTNTYVLEECDDIKLPENDKDPIKTEVGETPIIIKEETPDNSKNEEIPKTSHVNETDPFSEKEIIYISDNDGSAYSTIILKGIIQNNDLIKTLKALEILMDSNINKIIIHRHLEHYSELMIDLEIEKKSIDETLLLLKDANWKNQTKKIDNNNCYIKPT